MTIDDLKVGVTFVSEEKIFYIYKICKKKSRQTYRDVEMICLTKNRDIRTWIQYCHCIDTSDWWKKGEIIHG